MSRDFPAAAGNLFSLADPAPVDITGTALTIHCWIRPDTLTVNRTPISKYDANAQSDHQYALSVLSTGKVQALIGDATSDEFVNGVTNVATGVWSAIGMRKDGTGAGSLAAFLNGINDGNMTSAKSIQNTASTFRIGELGGANNPVDGLLAEVGIWNVALTDAEMMALAKGVSPRLIRPGNLKGYWPLWGTGSPERDQSGQGSHLTMSGTVNAGTIHAPVMPFVFTSVSLVPGGVSIYQDAATVYLNLETLEVETFDEVYLDLQASGTEQRISTDAETIYLDLSVLGGECYSQWTASFLGEGEAWTEFSGSAVLEWSGVGQLQWSPGSIVVEGINC